MRKKTLCLILTAGITVFCLTGCGKEGKTEGNVVLNDEAGIWESSVADTGNEDETVNSDGESETPPEETTTDLNAELSAIEKSAQEFENQLQEVTTQGDMNLISCNEFQLWDDELNSLWSRFSERAPEELKTTVLLEQRNWIANKENEVKAAGEPCEGGSIRPLIENTKAMELTRARCYEMAGYLAKATNQSFTLEMPKAKGLYFVDRQGTDDIYSDLSIEETDENNYAVTIGIYRLTTFEGSAVLQEDGTYLFEDENSEVKGVIRISDDGSGAAFEVTETTWSLISAGDVFEFPELG